MRLKKMRLPQKKVFRWLYKHFGVGGFRDYDFEQQAAILRGLKLLCDTCGLVELEFVGKFLLKLSDNPKILNEFLEEIEDY